VELRHLRYFVAVAEELHFGRAASRPHIVQPALSKQIIGLERELGIALFDRTKGVKLTAAGAVFLDEARAVLQRADSAVHAAQATARGELGTLDIGFVRPRAIDDVLVFETVWREQFVLALPDEHPLASAEAIDLADLTDETFITLPRPDAPRLHDLHVATCLSYGFTPKLSDQGNSPAALSMVASGLGVALIPESAQNVGWTGIVFRPLIRPTPEVELTAAYRSDNGSAALRSFLDTVRSTIAAIRSPARTAGDVDSPRGASLAHSAR